MQVVQAHIDAFNKHDIDAFLTHISEDIMIEDGRGALILMGRHAFAPIIGGMLIEHPDLRIELLDRMALGQWVVDESIMMGRVDGSSTHTITIYRVFNGEITTMTTIRDTAYLYEEADDPEYAE